MQSIKRFIKSPWMLVSLMIVKLVTYYYLIDVSLLTNVLALGSIAVLLLMFFEFGTSNLKHKTAIFFVLYTGFTILMFADTMYYNYYHQTVSVKQLWQASNVAKVPNSFIATLIPLSFILLLEVPCTIHFFRKYSTEWAEKFRISRKFIRKVRYITVTLVLFIAINPFGIKQLRKMNTVEFFTNHLNDVFTSAWEDVSFSSVDAEEVKESVKEVTAVKDSNNTEQLKLNGIAKGKNLVVIQVESLQNFVLGARYNGKELTPHLNSLMKRNSLYFDNYYSTIGKGNTVDAEFSTLNSLYPVIDRECYSLYTKNTYNGLPWLLREQGYSTSAIHGYSGSFWNREQAYPYQGFEEFYSQEDLDDSEIIGLGISDKSMFRQASEILSEQKKPFFSFVITLTNHHPYILPDVLSPITLKEEDEGTAFGNYLKTVAYTDQAIGEFIQELKNKGLYDNTVIAIYGDHHGLNCTMDENHDKMTEFLGKDYDFDEMFNIPLIIHIPGSGLSETISTTGGQIDFLPTIANLFDLDIPQPYVLGRDLVNSKSGFAAFTAYMFEGSFVKDNVMFEISREKIFDGSRAWNTDTGEELEYKDYEDDYNYAVKLKETSKYILDQDLMSEMFDHSKDIVLPEKTESPKETANVEDKLD